MHICTTEIVNHKACHSVIRMDLCVTQHGGRYEWKFGLNNKQQNPMQQGTICIVFWLYHQIIASFSNYLYYPIYSFY